MALTGPQKVSLRLALGEPKTSAAEIDSYLGRLDSYDEAALVALLVIYDSKVLNVTRIDTAGVMIDPQEKVAIVRNQIATALGWSSSNDATVFVGRGAVGAWDTGFQSQSVDSGWS